MKKPDWLVQNEYGVIDIPNNVERIYAIAHLIRATEEKILKLFSEGYVSGTVHTALGQEICQLGVVRCLKNPADGIFSNHRNHGHFLAHSGNVEGLVAEILGKQAGVCEGKGGSQHLAYKNFHSSGVQGGLTGIAVGMAKAQQLLGTGGIVAVFIGDGTLGEGLLYESMNLASVWKSPVLFVVENNQIAQTTMTIDVLGGSIDARGKAFGLATWVLSDRSPTFFTESEAVVNEIRCSRQPGFLVINTARMGPHSKGDDFRTDSVMGEIYQNDPLSYWGSQLPPEVRHRIESANFDYLNDVVKSVSDFSDAILQDKDHKVFPSTKVALFDEDAKPISTGASINAALAALLRENHDVLLLGEDLHDPYGGAFKVTKGLSTEFPERVISTPISEAGIVGTAIGLAMSGMRPVVEIMFADFLTLCMDQIYNHAVKISWLFGHPHIPLVIRSPSGGHRGYGPTHSQSLEHLYSAVPGITVVYPSCRHDSGQLLKQAVMHWGSPVMFFEHKLMYREIQQQLDYETEPGDADDPGSFLFPTLVKKAANPDITLITYGGTLRVVEEVAEYLMLEELKVEVVVPALISPLPMATLARRLIDRKKIFIIEEAPKTGGIGAELIACIVERGYTGHAVRIGPLSTPIPAARKMERSVLPVRETIIREILKNL